MHKGAEDEEERVLDSQSKLELTRLWNALGLSAGHQAQELDSLRQDLHQVVAAKLQYVRGGCERFRQDIDVLKQEIQALRRQQYREDEQQPTHYVSQCVPTCLQSLMLKGDMVQYDHDAGGTLLDRLVALTIERDCLRKVHQTPEDRIALVVSLTISLCSRSESFGSRR